MPPRRKAKQANVAKTTANKPKKITKATETVKEQTIAEPDLSEASTASDENEADKSAVSYVNGTSFVGDTNSESEMAPTEPISVTPNKKRTAPKKVNVQDRSMPSLETESESEAKIDETATENETETETENDTEAETEPAAGRKREVSGRRGNQNPKPVETASDSEAKSDDESEPVKGTRTLRGKAGAQQTATKNAKTTVRSPPKSQQETMPNLPREVIDEFMTKVQDKKRNEEISASDDDDEEDESNDESEEEEEELAKPSARIAPQQKAAAKNAKKAKSPPPKKTTAQAKIPNVPRKVIAELAKKVAKKDEIEENDSMSDDEEDEDEQPVIPAKVAKVSKPVKPAKSVKPVKPVEPAKAAKNTKKPAKPAQKNAHQNDSIDDEEGKKITGKTRGKEMKAKAADRPTKRAARTAEASTSSKAGTSKRTKEAKDPEQSSSVEDGARNARVDDLKLTAKASLNDIIDASIIFLARANGHSSLHEVKKYLEKEHSDVIDVARHNEKIKTQVKHMFETKVIVAARLHVKPGVSIQFKLASKSKKVTEMSAEKRKSQQMAMKKKVQNEKKRQTAKKETGNVKK